MPGPIPYDDILKRLEKDDMLGPWLRKDKPERGEERYNKLAGRPSGRKPPGTWEDGQPFETLQWYADFARHVRSPGRMPKAKKTPGAYTFLHRYQVKAKSAYREVRGLTKSQAYHLSFGHELIHAYRLGADAWREVPAFVGYGVLAILGIGWASLFLAGILSFWSVQSFAIAALLVMALAFLPDFHGILTNRQGGPGMFKEEVIAEIGAAQLAVMAGSTKLLTDYSAGYISEFLGRMDKEHREQALWIAFNKANERYGHLVALRACKTPRPVYK